MPDGEKPISLRLGEIFRDLQEIPGNQEDRNFGWALNQIGIFSIDCERGRKPVIGEERKKHLMKALEIVRIVAPENASKLEVIFDELGIERKNFSAKPLPSPRSI